MMKHSENDAKTLTVLIFYWKETLWASILAPYPCSEENEEITLIKSELNNLIRHMILKS